MKDLVAAADQISLQGQLGVLEGCHGLSIPRSIIYNHRSEGLTASETADRELTPTVMNIFWKHKRLYETRRIADDLADGGLAVSRKRIANIMKTQ